MKLSSQESARTLRVRGGEGDAIPEAFVSALEGARVTAGWIRGVGVVADVVLRTVDESGTFVERRAAGPLQLVSLEGLVSTKPGESSLSAVLAHDGPSGAVTLAGALVSARLLAFDAMLVELGGASAGVAVAAPAEAAWGEAIAASTQRENRPAAAPKPAAPLASAPIPQRPKPAAVEVEQPVPDPGDLVEHFAFGMCEVVKSDGDRIHLRLEKDQRIKEIALAMLRVVPIDVASSPKLWRLERRL